MNLPEKFSLATTDDIDLLEKFVNNAYRGNESKKGWTTEADLLGGIRTDKQALKEMLSRPEAVILKYEGSEGLLGCVYLEKQDDDLYLGMLTVLPGAQKHGIGSKVLEAAEQYAREMGCASVKMTVISVRTELIKWYERRGYYATGEKKPFPDDPRFGIPKQPLEFIVMKKKL